MGNTYDIHQLVNSNAFSKTEEIILVSKKRFNLFYYSLMSQKIILGVYIPTYKYLQLQNFMGVTWLMMTKKS